MLRRIALAVLVVSSLAPALSAGASSAPGLGSDRAAAQHGGPDRPAGGDGHGHRDGSGHPRGHEAAEGLALQPETGESVSDGAGPCPRDLPVRRYDVVAIAVRLTLNRYGDHDPEGRMYALASEVDRIRAEEDKRAEGVSVGLQGDAIQPLVLRVNQGECLRVRLTNRLRDEPASFHLHASSLEVAGGRGPATADNDAALAEPGEAVTYEWLVAGDEPEGTHVFHSHGDARQQSGHGLFGTLVVEPAGSEWLDPRTAEPGTSGWDAIIDPGDGARFREFVLAYHEIGHEDYKLRAADLSDVPVVDPTTSAYRPGARAINYRSEPFMNRLRLQHQRLGRIDESVAYSSYAFGDPATPVMRTYLGDPVKERVVHAGSEVFHVHHVHGGSVRWRRQPGAGPTGSGTGLTKRPDLLPGPSERTDSQSIGPSEAFDVDHECSAGGCQQGAGDYLFHCHVAHHYFAGMWGIWRVYNTLQDGAASTDALPPLPALSVSPTAPAAAVDSAGLVGRTVEWGGRRTTITAANVEAWASGQLPPRGQPRPYDASVWDWGVEGGRLVGEPETADDWPGYRSRAPATRPPILFDPRTGKLAYPLLRPHLGARPPFAPAHGPAPYLDPPLADGSAPEPGASGRAGLCPTGTSPRTYNLHAIELPVPINARAGIVDPGGNLFVLKQDEDRVRADPNLRTPLAIRANAGEHCVDVVLKNEIPDTADHPFSKVSAHIHFVQFDVQAGDGVDTGFNYEQTVRPFTAGAVRLAADVPEGATRVDATVPDPFSPGSWVGVGMDEAETFEIRRVVATEGAVVVLDRPLAHPHRRDEIVSTEFVRYRWYPDAQVGTSYFHDHVNGLQTWTHGLVGALVVEPPGSTYRDPRTGEEVTSGPVVDVHSPAAARLSADVTGSFRELVSFVQDGSELSGVGRSPGSNLNLRANLLSKRAGPTAREFASAAHGDPETPIVEAYVGDPVVVRATVSGTNEVHTWHLDGHWFRRESFAPGSTPVSTALLGISERMDLVVPAAGGPQRRPGDYLYYNGRALKLQEGSWGLLRVRPGPAGAGLEPLPGRPPPTGPPPPVCPPGAPTRRFDVAAVEARLPMLSPGEGRLFVPASAADAVVSGRVEPEPLVLRVAVGDCIEVALENRLPAGSPPVSLHADGLAFDPADSYGVEAGRNPPQVVDVGDVRSYRFFAHPEYGETVALLRDGGDLARSPGLGLYGAVVVGPTGVTFSAPVGTQADAQGPDGAGWRDVVVFMQDEDDAIGSHRMPYTTKVRGTVGLNYGKGDTVPAIEAYAGDPLRVHVLAPWSEQAQVFSIEGHRWPREPGMPGSAKVESMAIGGLEAVTVVPEGGAGGPARLPGTYGLGSHREPYREAGLWGRFVVHDRCLGEVPGLAPLEGVSDGCGSGNELGSALALAAPAFVGVGAVAALWRRRRHRRRRPSAAV